MVLTGILINLKTIKLGHKLKDNLNLVLFVLLISVLDIDPNVAFDITEVVIGLERAKHESAPMLLSNAIAAGALPKQ